MPYPNIILYCSVPAKCIQSEAFFFFDSFSKNAGLEVAALFWSFSIYRNFGLSTFCDVLTNVLCADYNILLVLGVICLRCLFVCSV